MKKQTDEDTRRGGVVLVRRLLSIKVMSLCWGNRNKSSLKGMLDSSGNQLKDPVVSLLTDDSNNTYLQVTNVGQVLLVQVEQFQLEETFIFSS